ncbi:MAG: methionyl-tRNA formyltransferase, partial [Acidimicrobiales bacterium]
MARLVYLGTPEVAVGPLRALVESGHDIGLVVTGEDKRRGRGRLETANPVKQAAEQLGLEVSHRVPDVTTVGAELGVVVAFGALIKPDVLAQVPMINLHFSLLPRWRGAAPVERAILAGDIETGVCLMAVEEGLDTGGVYARRTVVVEEGETAHRLRSRLARLGAEMLVEALSDLPASLGRLQAQQGEATYAAKITPQECELDFARSAVELERVVRVGRAWTTWDGARLGVLRARVVAPGAGHVPRAGDLGIAGLTSDQPRAEFHQPRAGLRPGSLTGRVVATGDGGLELIEVQPAGRRAMAAEAWLNGLRPSG